MISGAIVSSRTRIAQTAVRANPITRFTECSPCYDQLTWRRYDLDVWRHGQQQHN